MADDDEECDVGDDEVGAGDGVDGQLVIFHDLVGLFFEFKSKFVKRYCDARILIQESLKDYADEVRDGSFPTKENFYELKEEELEKMLSDAKWKYEPGNKKKALKTDKSDSKNSLKPIKTT